ncbi:MAG: hypothetical protein Q8O89_00565 [Nanoarchaeota archaeon]|nr:hypothetical protein [Nanoarchaeota archaeon]
MKNNEINPQNIIGFFSDSHGLNEILFANLDAGIAAGIDKFYNAGDTTPKSPKGALIKDELFDGGIASECRAVSKGLEANPELVKQFLTDSLNSVSDLANVLGAKYSKVIKAMISGNAEVIVSEYMKKVGMNDTIISLLEDKIDFKTTPFVHVYNNGQLYQSGISGVDACVLGLPHLKTSCVEEIAYGIKNGTDDTAAAKKILEKQMSIIKAVNPSTIIQVQHEHPREECSVAVGTKKAVNNPEIYEMAMDFVTNLIKDSNYKTQNYTILYGHVGQKKRVQHNLDVNGVIVPTIHINEGTEMLYANTKNGQVLPEGTFMPK